LASLKKEKCPQLSAKDLLDLLGLRVTTPESPSVPSSSATVEAKSRVIVVDVRTREE
jgi:hypothetical protein